VVGSYASPGADGSFASAEIVLDIPLSEDEIADFYYLSMPGLGWEAAPAGPGHAAGGFLSVWGGHAGATFCRSPKGPSLTVRGSPSGVGAGTDVRVRVHVGPGPCARFPGFWARPTIPPLRPPRGVRILLPGVATGEDRQWIATTTAKTELGPEDLDVHYSAQLRAAGWRRVTGQSSAEAAISMWQIEIENRTGMGVLVSARGQHEDEVTLLLISTA
jgi:hypothetical protein